MENIYWAKVKSHKLKNTQWTLTGYSVAARSTGFYIPELKIALDCGVPSSHSPDHIFITHGHLDHCGYLNNTILDINTNNSNNISINTNIFVPIISKNYFKDYIHHAFALTKNTAMPKIHNKYNLIGVDGGEVITLKIKKMTYKINIIRCFHTVPCVAYGFSEVRTKLKPEFIGYPESEIIKLKSMGEEITYSIEIPQFCFIGDTDERIFKNTIILEKFPTIIIECTFLYPEHENLAKKDKHMHWNKLENYIKTHPETTVILIHFSARYTDTDIRKFFLDKLYDNIIVWI
jgi:ribonuclease Z